jgi:class 3 adenylate cyclase
MTLISVLIEQSRIEEAEQRLRHYDVDAMPWPGPCIQYYANLSAIRRYHNDIDGARVALLDAVKIATDIGSRSDAVELQKQLRDLAQLRQDFAGYIEHNVEYQRISDEIRGHEATRKLAMVDTQKKLDAERADKERHRLLLHNTLPPSIAERVLRGEQVNDSYDNAAVLFLDLVGFTTMSSSMAPDDVVTLLSQIFTAFDTIVANHDLMKIKTIGDSYMAVAFGEQPMLGCEQRAANCALDMLKAVSHVVSPTGSPIQARIGLHVGPVTAGIIGTQRMQYDVWGDTVNVASRMESHGEPGRVHVSEPFAQAICYHSPSAFTLIERGELIIKGKGAMLTYFLEPDAPYPPKP